MFAIRKLAASSALAKARTLSFLRKTASRPFNRSPRPVARTRSPHLAASTRLLGGMTRLGITAGTLRPAITPADKGIPLPAPAGTRFNPSIENAKGLRSLDRKDAESNTNPKTLVADAERMLAANAGLERTALAKLSAADRQAYLRVKARLGDQEIAKAVLQDWLIQSTLGGHGALPREAGLGNLLAYGDRSVTAGARNKDGQTMLGALDRLATQPLAGGIDRAELLSNVIRETANPATQHQDGRNSCAITTTTIKLALANPAEYVRLAAGLASPAGKVKLANGDTVRRPSDWANTDDGNRSTSGRLLYPALMAYANPGYDNSSDKAKYLGIFNYEGTGPGNWQKVVEGVFNRGFDEALVFPWNADEIVDKLAKETAAGRPTPVSFTWGDSRHVVLVTGVKNGRVHFINPYGEFNSISIGDFKKNCGAVMFERSGNVFERIFDDTNPAKALGNGLSNLDRGAQSLNPFKIAGGLVQALGGGVVGGVVAAGGKYLEKGGDWLIGKGRKLWNKGVLGKIGGGALIGIGAIGKGLGWGVKKAGNAISFAFDKIGGAVSWVGDKVWSAGKKVANGVANTAKKAWNGAKNVAKKAWNGAKNVAKKIFSGW